MTRLTLLTSNPTTDPTTMLYTPDIIYIDARVRGLPATQRILSHLPGVSTELIEDMGILRQAHPHRNGGPDFSVTKRQWVLTQSQKRWYRSLEQTETTTRLAANFVTNTPYDCSYCPAPILLARSPYLTIMVNVEEAMADLGRRCAADPKRQITLRCGERGDALALDTVTHNAEALIPFFAHTPNARLELCTRTAQIDHLFDLPHRSQTTIVLTVTPPSIIEREERGTASLEERLDAAQRLAKQGFRIIYAIDPVINFPGWEHEYDALIDQLLQHTPSDALERIELSCFYHPRGLAAKSAQRFPESRIFFGELVPVNGSYRYVRPLRQQMYRYLRDSIRRRSEEVPIQLVQEHGLLAEAGI